MLECDGLTYSNSKNEQLVLGLVHPDNEPTSNIIKLLNF
ncbi:protein of unknown function [Candidatus Nitrosocosmicus franklandus]|uniref:Uncharacterized protein n=1 Tax=Candidatus Nitrosocosmicus franklandianus TaxID=1798806 RepID=A0A484ICP9_9ARCH|nr:protein of unknown function [Candidatus Nitrosocosmicus franklandus]